MHRSFGRSAQQKVKDRWGGGFILATILALLAAWYIGKGIGDWANGRTASTDNGNTNTAGGGTVSATAEPKDFQLHFVRVGIFASPANSAKAIKAMSDAGLSPVLGAHTTESKIPVYVGPFDTAEATNAALAKVQTLANDYKGAYAVTMNVNYNPAVVSAAAVSGGKDTDMKKGLDTLNSYIQEVAMWIENRSAAATVDTTSLVAHGRSLGDLAAKLSDSKDASVKKFADMATLASKNAAAVEGLTSANATDAGYQSAMADYITLVNQYTAYQTGK
jgi:hypothetical protein